MEWSQIVPGEWLARDAQAMREPATLGGCRPWARAARQLRPYQETELHWLWFMTSLGLGACLADDMGLGKTIQVLSLLLVAEAGEPGRNARPSLLVAPASLLANWKTEIARFAPSLKVLVAHPSETPAEKLKAETDREPRRHRSRHHHLRLSDAGALARQPDWRLAIARRSPGDQEPGGNADPAGQALRPNAHRAHRHAGRESARRPVVDLRFPQSRPAGVAKQFSALRQTPRRASAGPLRAAARSGAPLHSAPPQDRQEHHRRPAGQDRGEDVLSLEPQAGGALPAGCGGTERPARGGGRHAATGPGARLPDAPEADLQPSLAVARRRCLGRS